MAKLLGTIPGFWYYDMQGSELKGGSFSITDGAGIETYYDYLGEVARSDPIVLDSAGVAITYLDTDAEFTVVISDGDGTALDSVSELTAVPSPFLAAANINTNGNSIVSSSNGDIAITSVRAGSIVLDGLKWPDTDGAAGQLVSTDGEGRLSTTSLSSFTLLSSGSSPQLGGDLDTNSYNIKIGNGTINSSNYGTVILSTGSDIDAVNYCTITNSETGTGTLISSAGSDTNVDLKIDPKGTGKVRIGRTNYNNLCLPASDGNTNCWIETDGSSNLSFVPSVSSGITSELPMASQAEMKAPVSSAVYASPENLAHHPGVPKAWALLEASAYSAPAAGYNISSAYVFPSSSVEYSTATVNLSVTMANTDYVVIVNPGWTNYANMSVSITERTTTSFKFVVRPLVPSGYASAWNAYVTVFGELA